MTTPTRSTSARLDELTSRTQDHLDAEAAATAKQHPRGKKTARERIESLLDPGSFSELDAMVTHRSHNF
ncbi:MAG: methylmalonyl-CoA carboxyltransferase, partial [Micrococcales bacterium]|nr:methylmalonyl-CoA carboxyltransferase [Micrococcales bacterium]